MNTSRPYRIMLLALAIMVMAIGEAMASGANASSSAAASWANRLGLRQGDKVVPLGIRYTKQHPLIIVSDWNFPPYSFMNDSGEPDGFHIQLINELHSMIHVPYQIQMMEWKTARKKVITGEANLVIGIQNKDESNRVHYGKSVVATYPVGVARLRNTKPIRSIEIFAENDTVFTNFRDYADNYICNYFHQQPPFTLLHSDIHKAMAGILEGKVKYFITGKAAMNDFIRRYNLQEQMVIDDIDIPEGQFRFISNDKVLLQQIDEQFVRLKNSNRYAPMLNRWLSEDGNYEEDMTLVNIFVVVGMIMLIVMGVLTFIVIIRNRASGDLKREFKAIANMSIEVTDCNVFAINTKRMWVYNVSGDFLPREGLSFSEFEKLIHPEDIVNEYDARKRVDAGEKDMPPVRFRMRKHRGKPDNWRNVIVSAYVKSDYKGQPTYIYLAVKDDTEHLLEQQKLSHGLKEFVSITEISELGMAYYDVNGRFINCNKAMIQLFDQGGLHKAEQFLHATTIYDIPLIFNGFVVEEGVHAWFCSPIDIPELNLHTNMEVRVESVMDEIGRCQGYSINVFDLTEYIELYRKDNMLDKRISRQKNGLQRYQQEVRFILKKNGIHSFRWSVGNDYFDIYDDFVTPCGRMPFKDFITSLNIDDAKEIHQLIEDPKQFFSRPFCTMMTLKPSGRHSYFNIGADSKQWFSFSVVPDFDSDGRSIGAFGLITNVTPYMQAQESLRQLKKDSENLSQQLTTFLASMNHELRTPLQFIGSMADGAGECTDETVAKEKIQQIHHQCTMLVNVVTNILRYSMYEVDGLNLKQRNVAFAEEFPKTVMAMKKYLTPDSEVQFIVDDAEPTPLLFMDYERVINIVDTFVHNAAKFTTKGSIRVGYTYTPHAAVVKSLLGKQQPIVTKNEENSSLLTIYCEDTGCGISADKQQEIFSLFRKLDNDSKGTGLGLYVSHLTAQAMGASITVESTEGKGTRFTLLLNVTPAS